MRNLFILTTLLILFCLFNSCERNNDLINTSTVTFLYQPNSDTCSNCAWSYIVFHDSQEDTVPVILDCRVPLDYRVKEGVEVTVKWKISDKPYMPYIFPKNFCGPRTIPFVIITKFFK